MVASDNHFKRGKGQGRPSFETDMNVHTCCSSSRNVLKPAIESEQRPKLSYCRRTQTLRHTGISSRSINQESRLCRTFTHVSQLTMSDDDGSPCGLTRQSQGKGQVLEIVGYVANPFTRTLSVLGRRLNRCRRPQFAHPRPLGDLTPCQRSTAKVRDESSSLRETCSKCKLMGTHLPDIC